MALGALASYWRDRSAGSGAISTSLARGSGAKPVLGFVPVLALAFFGGLVSLSYEIFFFRTVSFATGSSASGFALTLGAFLIGLASGSRKASETRKASESCRRTVDEAIQRVLRDVIVANLLGFLFLPLRRTTC